MAISVQSKGFQAVLLFSYLSLISSHGYSLSFNFSFEESTNKDYSNITCTGDALVRNNECQNLAQYGLTKNILSEGIDGSVGGANYKQPVPLWDTTTGEVTNFATTFSFKIKNTTVSDYADGLAFYLAPYPPPPVTNGAGGTLGLFNYDSTMFDESANHIVGVEFDTFSNNWDIWPSCHIGIDINRINSTNSNSQSIPCYLFIDKNMTAQISYNNLTQNLTLYLWRDDNRTINFNISNKVDLKSILPQEMAIGFTAATGELVELHQIYSWSFNSTLETNTNIPKKNSRSLSNKVIGALIASALVFLLLLGMLLYYIRSRRSAKKNSNRETEIVYDESMDSEFEKERGPKRFLYNELASVTKDFAENEKLGEGGFGSVYRGFLVNEGTEVAIKRVSKDSKQGKKEYISEVRIISQLRHRNLVQLIGWCHDRGEFLLVYELMQNGSLDTHLYHKERVLTWPMRYKIVQGVGFALFYLHEECQQCVVHRDIKPSNIMLDSNFNAKLGDFGLARLIDHNVATQATLPAGTTGYIAPECVITGITSADSDIFSFGIVLLEVACGRQPILLYKEEHEVRLVEWVWSLYGSGSILEAIDHRLNGEFEAQEAERLMVVGLWCAHPDCSLRPSIRQAINVLYFDAPLPTLPPRMPIPTYAAPISSTNFLYSSSTGISSGEIGHASTSYTASSSNTSEISPGASSSSWLLKERGT